MLTAELAVPEPSVPYTGIMTAERQPVGRRRDSRVDHAILTATRHLLATVGYQALTVDGIAAQARVGKAAIYRRYASKQEVVLAAAVQDEDITVAPDTGSLAGDLRALVGVIVASLTTPTIHAAMPGLLADLAAKDSDAARTATTFLAAKRALIEEVLDRATRRSELAARPDSRVVHALLFGPIFAWLFLFRQDSSDELAATVAQLATAALTATGTPQLSALK